MKHIPYNSKDFEKVGLDYYESLVEFNKAIATNKTNSAFSNYYCASQSKDEDFTGTKDFETAQALMKSGYKEGLQNLLQAKTNICVKNPSKKTQRILDVCGSAPCVTNAILGLPKTMYHTKPQTKKFRTIIINYDVDIHGGQSKDIAFKGGKNVMALIKFLESKGIRVQMNIFSCAYKDNKFACLKVKAKDFTQALNPLLISYPVTHSSFLRRHVFRWTETSSLTNYTCFYGYGAVGRNHKKDFSGFMQSKGIFKANEFFIDVDSASYANSIEDLLNMAKITL